MTDAEADWADSSRDKELDGTKLPMNTLQQKQLAFLEETVAHFNSTNRAVTNYGYCKYSHKVNGGCAIGRKVSAELAEKLSGSVNNCFDLLPEELKELGKKFLYAVQRLHDNNYPDNCPVGLTLHGKFWNETGLSDEGKKVVEWIKKKYQLV